MFLLAVFITTGSMQAMERNLLAAGSAASFILGGFAITRTYDTAALERALGNKKNSFSPPLNASAPKKTSLWRSLAKANNFLNIIPNATDTLDETTQKFYAARSARWGYTFLSIGLLTTGALCLRNLIHDK